MPVVVEKSTFQFAFITAQAEEQIKELQPSDLMKVLKVLQHPVRRDRCKRMTVCGRFWRVRVTRDLRIVFFPVRGQACGVVYIAAHQSADRFVKRGYSAVLQDFKPLDLKEYDAVKKNPINANVKPQETKNHAVTEPTATEWEECVKRGFRKLVEDLMTDGLDVIQESVADQLSEELKVIHSAVEQINPIRDLVHGQAETITALTARINNLADEHQRGEAELKNHAIELTKLNTALRTDLQRYRGEIAQLLERISQGHEQQIAAGMEKLIQLATTADERSAAIAEVTEAQNQRSDRIGEEILALDQQLRNESETRRALIQRVEQIEATVDKLSKVMDAIVQERELTMVALAEMKKQREDEKVAAASRSWQAWMRCMANNAKSWFTRER